MSFTTEFSFFTTSPESQEWLMDSNKAPTSARGS